MFLRLMRRAWIRWSDVIAALRGQGSKVTLHAVIQRDGEWYVGWVEEIPGANTQGATVEEVRENLLEAVHLIIETNREDSQRAVGGGKVHRESLRVAV